MVVRLRIALEQEEYSALLKLALAEERNPEGQLRFILRTELHNRGFLILSPESGLNGEDKEALTNADTSF